MAAFDWDEYKEFKKFSGKEDKLQVAIDFMRSYYNMSSPRELYEMLREDDIGQMMLDKREITDAEGLENFMFQ
ncbi:hypothetical protein [Sulfurimonas sp.]|uniref:hypothetical protein n=1 Tax=Sulfurimonas sp. TaxID=2022749 RepID=UPI00356B01EE